MKSLFPVEQKDKNSKSILPHTDWLKCNSAPIIEDEERPKSEVKKEKKEKKEKKKEKEKLKILEFEKNRIRIDPRSEITLDKILQKEELYTIDTKGDPNNLLFHQPYLETIPEYQKLNDPIEISKWKQIKRENERNTYIYEKGKIRKLKIDNDEEYENRGEKRYFKGRIFEKEDEIKRITSLIMKNQECEKEYIPLEVKEDFGNDDRNEETFEDYINRRTKEFNEKTRESPNDVELWLNFIKFQNEKKQKGIIEKKISIYEVALNSNPYSIPLIIGYLKELRNLQSNEVIEQKWEQVLEKISWSEELWIEYLAFKKSNFSTFNISSIRKIYEKVILNFSKLKNESACIFFFNDLCNFERHSGYKEKGISLFQSLIEINLNLPLYFGTFQAQLSSFKSFWESEAPRIGEEDGNGWKEWLLNVDLDEISNDDDEDDESSNINQEESTEDILDIVKDKDIFFKWLSKESKYSKEQWKPCKPLQDFEIIEKSPDRIIIYDDLKNYLFPLQNEKNQLFLIYLFLEYLGVNILYHQYSMNDLFLNEILLNYASSKHFYSIFQQDKFEWNPNLPIDDPELRKFIRNVFIQSLKLFPNDLTLEISFLEFESQNMNTFQEYSNEILSNHSDSIVLYNHYIQILKRNNLVDKSIEFYKAFLNNIDYSKDFSIIYRSFAEILFPLDKDYCIHVLCSCVENQKFEMEISNTNSRILICEKRYEELFQEFLQSEDKFYLIEFVLCYCLLEHFIKGPKKVEEIFEKCLKKKFKECKREHYMYSLLNRYESNTFGNVIPSIELGDVFEQYIWLFYLKYIFHYSNINQLLPYYNKKKSKEVLKRFLLKYPSHPIGLSLFIEQERYFSTFLDTLTQRISSPIIYLYSIYSELKKENFNRVRSLFEKVFDNNLCKSNIMLWRMYIRFELSQGNVLNAKKIFYRAINVLPYSKSIWLDILKLFDDIKVEEIKEIIDLMMEKEINFRTNLEEYINKEETFRAQTDKSIIKNDV